jgi:hypothetical protein
VCIFCIVRWFLCFLAGILAASTPAATLMAQSLLRVLQPHKWKYKVRIFSGIHKWPAYTSIHGSQDLFVFHDKAGILFIFAKRHFTTAQINALQRLIQEHQSKS